MLNDKIKVRISNFVLNIIENDCLSFGFIKKDNSPNKNDFLNKLIPNLLKLRKFRREKIQDTLRLDLQKENAEEIYHTINYLIDQVYFYDAELEVLDADIWIRPNKRSLNAFDEIENNETKITCLDLTHYLRGLLNEYSRFPEYKRLSILFDNELQIIQNAQDTKRLLNFRYNNKKCKLYVYNFLYGYIADQKTYVVGFETNTNQIKSFLLQDMKNIFIIQQKFKVDKELEKLLEEYVNNYDFANNKIIQITEGDDEN